MRTMGVRSLLRPQTHATARTPQAEHYVNQRAGYALLRPRHTCGPPGTTPMRTRPHPRPCPGGIAKIENQKFKPALTHPARGGTDRTVMAGPSADASALSTARSSDTPKVRCTEKHGRLPGSKGLAAGSTPAVYVGLARPAPKGATPIDTPSPVP